ncbi:hypothetical protein [Thiothrix unzii]|uniref:Uncharacterized protein n=1 Tax=Thiothrix unzii TaxID=111769 RepID=A0A975IGK8_9GAMM|nr:hypothetical protein [Thiothrix unzii]QTR53136.1 hypothetical protein J9260_15725 [Thiothrix unzii]
MALRDWLNPDFDPLATEKPAICSKTNLKIAGIATVATGIAKSAILQAIDSKGELFRNSKNSRNSNSNAPELKKQGIARLEAAAAGLPVTLEELAVFFADDLQEFGQGLVKQAGIVQAVRWYAYQYKGMEEPRLEEIPAGMVRCIDCLQNRCTYRQVTPYGNVVMQSSPAWRWCDDYTARVHNLDDYRRR